MTVADVGRAFDLAEARAAEGGFRPTRDLAILRPSTPRGCVSGQRLDVDDLDLLGTRSRARKGRRADRPRQPRRHRAPPLRAPPGRSLARPAATVAPSSSRARQKADASPTQNIVGGPRQGRRGRRALDPLAPPLLRDPPPRRRRRPHGRQGAPQPRPLHHRIYTPRERLKRVTIRRTRGRRKAVVSGQWLVVSDQRELLPLKTEH